MALCTSLPSFQGCNTAVSVHLMICCTKTAGKTSGICYGADNGLTQDASQRPLYRQSLSIQLKILSGSGHLENSSV